MTDVQKHIMNIMDIIVPCIKGMNITFMMLGGTMLGAIRHRGFIPWDDDIDIGMFREDYEYFVNNISKLLPDYLELDTYDGVNKHHYYFARIVDKRYKIKRSGSAEERYENVWVDIFPLDGMPDNFILLQVHKLRLSIARFLYHFSCIEKVNVKRPGRPMIEKIVICIAMKLRYLIKIDTNKCLDRIDSLLKKYPAKDMNKIVSFMGQTTFQFKEIFDKKIYSELSDFPFEYIVLPGIKNYDLYLKSIYGDYMTPPKVSDRNAHVSEFIE